MFEKGSWKNPQLWSMNNAELKGFWCFVLLTFAYFLMYWVFSIFFYGAAGKHVMAFQTCDSLIVLYLKRMGPYLLLGYLMLGVWLPIRFILALRTLSKELVRLSEEVRNENTEKNQGE